ncbi:hypothetical protein VZG28_05160 [Synechococcus elongatus IITB4]|uniref:hypothetical protein n=1 Tax=Synechococcus elongatus TaxID=32046 RepID=UPI0030CFE5C8
MQLWGEFFYLNPMFVIAIAGNDGAGKSTVARSIRELIDPHRDCVIRPLAESLREEIRQFVPPTVDPWQKPTPEWLRDLLKGWGGLRRSQDPEYWIKAWVQGINLRESRPEIAIIDDLRYLNELNFVKERQGMVIFLDRQSRMKAGYELDELKRYADQRILVDPVGKVYASPTLTFHLINDFRLRQGLQSLFSA